MKSNREILVSYCPPVKDKNGNLVYKPDGGLVLPTAKKEGKAGHKMIPTPLYNFFISGKGLDSFNPSAIKGADGAMFMYIADELGVDNENGYSDGIIGFDLDHIDRNDANKIFNNLDKLSLSCRNLLAAYFSNSYNKANRNDVGLHVFMRIHDEIIIGNKWYKREVIRWGGYLATKIWEVLGIDVRPSLKLFNDKYEKSGLDPVSQILGQRFFLNHSSLWWNDKCTLVDATEIDEDYQKEWFEQKQNEIENEVKNNLNIYAPELVGKEKVETIYNTRFKRGINWYSENVKTEYKITRCVVKHDYNNWIEQFVNHEINYGRFLHDDRWKCAYFLTAETDWTEKDICEYLLKMCPEEEYKKGRAVLINSIRNDVRQGAARYRVYGTTKRNDVEYPAAFKKTAINVFKYHGINIEAEIERVYTPLEYKFDSIFEDVWEEHKDDEVVSKVYVDPENILRLTLSSTEYLMDYQDKIHAMVAKYEMTYLIADCMTGKTTLANNYKAIFSMFNEVDMFLYVRGNTIDVCFPYNSVADNKSKKYRRDLKRVKTKDIENYSFDLTNNFIWNTLMPLYDRYFSNGTTPKNFILFFDESQKIVTDEYRWEVVFEMFKVLPAMYKHFVFMTGTPAGEFFFLKQYFKDYCIIKVDKEINYKRKCEFLKYEQFGYRDRVNLIEETIADGRLPLIYTNVKRYEWLDACHEINKNRVESGLKPLRILEYSRANSERLEEVAETNSIKKYDVVIATKYCSVGIDFKKDDKRMRTAIIDYASEKDCTEHDIWQFTLRNRDQDTITKIIVNNNDMYNNKLYNFWYYVDLFDDMAKVHTHKKVEFEPEDELDKLNMAFVQEIFQLRKFGNLVYAKSDDKQYFKDINNVKLLSIYYLYRKIFSNINVIKRMLIERGVEIVEIDMPHIVERNESTTKKEIYDFFVDKFKEVGEIYHSREEYEEISKQIDVNSDDKEHIDGRIIYTRNKSYADWFIKNFAGKDEWHKILKEREFMSSNIFAEFNRMRMIAKRINKTIIKKLKSFKDNFNEEKFNKWVLERVKEDYDGVKDITNDEFKKELLFKDVVDDYLKIYRFSIDNIELIEEIKNANDEGIAISACHKMDIVMRQRQNEEAKKKMSAAGKKHAKKIIVRDLRDNLVYEFDSMLAAANHFGVSKSAFSKFVKNGSGSLKKVALVIAS